MESMREILGGQKMQIIEQLNEDLRHAHRIIDDLLRAAGHPGVCFSCARPVVRMGSLGLTEKVYNYNGEPHHCPLLEYGRRIEPGEVPHE
jgi:hypothetical protein